jgi:hypothetical protein
MHLSGDELHRYYRCMHLFLSPVVYLCKKLMGYPYEKADITLISLSLIPLQDTYCGDYFSQFTRQKADKISIPWRKIKF